MNNKPRLLITGVGGFIGHHLAKFYSNRGWIVVGIDCLPEAQVPGYLLDKYYSIKLPAIDIVDIVGTGFDVCFHCAGSSDVLSSIDMPKLDFISSVDATFNLLNALRIHSPQCKFIFLSSAAVYGEPEYLPVDENAQIRPLTPYGFHKYQCEMLCKEFNIVYGMKTGSVRIFSAYGVGLHRQVVWDICQQIVTSSDLRLKGTGGEGRDFIHIKDIIVALNLVVENAPLGGDVFNVACGQQITIRMLAEIITKEFGFEGNIIFDGVVPTGVPLNWCSDISKLRYLGFRASVSLQEGIEEYVAWARNRYYAQKP